MLRASRKGSRRYVILEEKEALEKTMTKLRYVHWIEEGFHIGYFEDYPDYRTQGKTLEELQDNLRDLFQDISSGNIPYLKQVDELIVS